MRNLRDAIFYLKMNVLQNFHTCISVPVIYLFSKYVACCAATVLPCTQLYHFFLSSSNYGLNPHLRNILCLNFFNSNLDRFKL